MKKILSFLLIAVAGLVPVHSEEKLKGGVAQLDITPPVGYPHYRDFGTAVEDPLYVKAFVLQQGKTKWAVAVCDLLWIERDLSAEVRLQVREKTGIPFEHIFLTATHTHTGPAYHSNIFELNSHRRKFDGSAEEAIARDGYPDILRDTIVEALVSAHDSAVPVTLETATGRISDLSFNRRFLLSDGKVRTNPGVGNRSIVKSVGPIDPELHTVLIERSGDGSLLGVVSNFAVHSDTRGGTAFSADYPGVLARELEKKLGEKVVSLFLQGASGDLNHVNVRTGSERLKTDGIGGRLAEEVLLLKDRQEAVAAPALGASSEVVYAPLQAYSEAELIWAEDSEAASKYGETGLFQLRRPMKIRSLQRIRQTEAVPPTIESEPWTLPVEVQTFRLSDEIAIVGIPGEVFVELGLAVKKASPFKTTIIVELTNVHIAYLPTRDAFREGGYETLNSRLAPGGGELLVESAIRQLQALKKQKN